MSNISTIIVAKGHPEHLQETIQSVQSISSEIIIMDIGLDTQLKESLLSNFQLKIIAVEEAVPYVELIRQKSFSYAQNEYILVLDPDEVITLQLAKLLQENHTQYDYIKIPRKNLIFGKWIEHSRWWPDYQIRFFKKSHLNWPTTLHAAPEVTGKGYTIQPKEELAITHYNYTDLDEFFAKYVRYAAADAKEKQDLKLNKTIDVSISEFISRFYADKGYKDNTHGFTLAFLQMMYPFLVQFYLWEQHKHPKHDEDKLLELAHDFFKKGFKESDYWISQTKERPTIMSRIRSFILQKLI